MTTPKPETESLAKAYAWNAAYRLQLGPQFTLYDAKTVLPYLKQLGISVVYLSPCLTATPGSEHGYDVCDPTVVSAELGGREAFSELAQAARQYGLALLLDIVPNHMTTHGSNRFFEHVLCHGRLSHHVDKFDLYDFLNTGEPITIGNLGRPYGDALNAHEISVKLKDGRFWIAYFEHLYPVRPATWALVLGATTGPLAKSCDMMRQLADLPPEQLATARLEYEALLSDLNASLAWVLKDDAAAVEARLDALNDDPHALDELMRLQHFRLVWWKLEGELVNYRRFFNIGSLVGVRMEDPEVFEWAHQEIKRLIDEGQVQGLRVDHPDGLHHPVDYFRNLRKLLPNGPIYVEKILDEEETLPEDWPVDGTVGYDFMNRVNRLWMDETRADALTSIYADFTGHPTNYLKLVREQKEFVLSRHFLGDLLRLTRLAAKVAASNYETRDLSLHDLERALVLCIVALPIYRTYLTADTRDPKQENILRDALTLARSFAHPMMESRVVAFDFLERALLGDMRSNVGGELLARFQQLAPAVMAKGAEDTTFYRYDRLLSCNEVGSQPSVLGISAEQFHQYLSHLGRAWPDGLLTSSTHDTKRSEDVRARISLISEMPERWNAMVDVWAEHNTRFWKGREPDRHAEYLLYQTLVGAHPLSPERAFAYIQKAVREAKIYTSWHEPKADYEEKLQDFIEGILADEWFQKSLDEFCSPLVHPGRINSLAQTLIKLTAPGIPDFYQGSELWDLSLVDPDNRRLVDFSLRQELLETARELSVHDLGQHWDSGLVKLWMIQRVLAVRNSLPDLNRSDYRPLIARGQKLRHVLSYARGEHLVVVVPRFITTIQSDFGDTQLELPEGRFVCAFSGKTYEKSAQVAHLFEDFPVALLVRSSSQPQDAA